MLRWSLTNERRLPGSNRMFISPSHAGWVSPCPTCQRDCVWEAATQRSNLAGLPDLEEPGRNQIYYYIHCPCRG